MPPACSSPAFPSAPAVDPWCAPAEPTAPHGSHETWCAKPKTPWQSSSAAIRSAGRRPPSPTVRNGPRRSPVGVRCFLRRTNLSMPVKYIAPRPHESSQRNPDSPAPGRVVAKVVTPRSPFVVGLVAPPAKPLRKKPHAQGVEEQTHREETQDGPESPVAQDQRYHQESRQEPTPCRHQSVRSSVVRPRHRRSSTFRLLGIARSCRSAGAVLLDSMSTQRAPLFELAATPYYTRRGYTTMGSFGDPPSLGRTNVSATSLRRCY